MKTSSLWIIRVALTVQFLGVLAVPAIVFAGESPRALWMAEWLPALSERSASRSEVGHESKGVRMIGILRLSDNTLSFSEQGQDHWQLDLSSINRVAVVNGPSTSLRASGGALLVGSVGGDEYVVSILEANLTPATAKRARATIESAIKLQAAAGR